MIIRAIKGPLAAAPETSTNAVDFEFDSVQRAFIADAAWNRYTSAWTMESWIKLETLQRGGFLAKWGPNPLDTAFIFGMVDATDILAIARLPDSNLIQVGWTWDQGTGTYVHLALTCDGVSNQNSRFELFQNSVSRGNGSVVISGSTVGQKSVATPFELGSWEVGGATEIMDGRQDQIRLHTGVLSQATIAARYLSVIDPATAGLDCSLRCDGDLTDDTANNRDFTGVNTPTFPADPAI